MTVTRMARGALATMLLLTLGGCAGLVEGPGAGAAADGGTSQGGDPALCGSAPASGGRTHGPVVTAAGHGWTPSGLDGPMPAPCTCRTRTSPDGQPLPDPACTPGAIDPAVTPQTVATTVCRKGGYTSSVRPPVSLTGPAKRKLLAAYGIDASQVGDYDLDHLIPLNSGGASDVRNLWPIRNVRTRYPAAVDSHNDKAVVEYYIFTALCQGRVTVSAVRAAMASDWTTAVRVVGLPAIPADYVGYPA